MTKEAPHEIDVSVGARIRTLRSSIGISQESLAERVKVTFQQIQKYEKGMNRVSASRLVMIAQALGVTAASLLPDDDAPDVRDALLQKVIGERDALKAQLAKVREIASPAPKVTEPVQSARAA